MLKKRYLYLLLICSCINLFVKIAHAAVFQNPNNKNVSYIFVPGIISIETQAAKYIPELVGSSGETIVCNSGIHTINHPITTCIFSETSPQQLSTQSINPFVYFGHWFTDKENKKYGVSIKRSTQNGNEPVQFTPQTSQTLEKHTFDPTKLNFAQEADMNALLKTYTEHTQKHPDSDVILYGVSRGAGTICTFMGKHQPQNVKALILEAPFDEIPHMLKHAQKTSFFYPLINSILPKITSYDPNGISPINSIENISKDIAILIVASDKDDVVPVNCAKSLKRRFNKLGHQKVHLLLLKNSTHSGYAFDNAADKAKYESVVHAFYKHYGLPYDEALASQGADEWKKISGEVAIAPIN